MAHVIQIGMEPLSIALRFQVIFQLTPVCNENKPEMYEVLTKPCSSAILQKVISNSL